MVITTHINPDMTGFSACPAMHLEGQRLKDGTISPLKGNNIPIQCLGFAPRLNQSFMGNYDKFSLELKTLFLQK